MNKTGGIVSHYDGTLAFSKIRETIDGNKFNDFLDVWVFHFNGEVVLSNAPTDEVAQVKWLDKNEILKIYKERELVSTLHYFFDNINERIEASANAEAVAILSVPCTFFGKTFSSSH